MGSRKPRTSVKISNGSNFADIYSVMESLDEVTMTLNGQERFAMFTQENEQPVLLNKDSIVSVVSLKDISL